MSERGSFSTEYIYCKDCRETAKKHLLEKTSTLCSQEISSMDINANLPIIAGKIGGSYASEEIEIMRSEIAPRLAKEICHNLRIVVMADSGDTAIFEIRPSPGIDPGKESIEPVQTIRKDQIDQSRNLYWLAGKARELGYVLRPMSQEQMHKNGR